MILDRIIKGFWGRYFFYLLVFVAVYVLMRNAIDNTLYSLGSLLYGQLEGCYSVIAWVVLAFLVIDPIYRKCTQKVTVVNQPLLAFILVPISAWYTIQILVPQTEKYILFDLLYKFILFATLTYSNIIAFEKSRKLRLNKKNSSSILKDEPISRDSKDELGFTIYADSISNHIKGIVDNERSFVFGIEGSWGSGKTSFINMVKARLKNHKEIRIVDFNPWMSSSSKQITADFFKRMTEEVSGMLLKAKFREYGKLLAAADKTGIVEKVVDKISTSQDLGTMLESINYCIEREKFRFVVFIDDTDRLDKEELLAMFKLVRNTASFRNTIFVLTYDRDYVESVLKNYFKDEHTAKAYPDKIVNFQFELPSSTKTYYDILKEKINHSEYIKAHPEIRLNDGDLPKGITALFDNYRKVKKVFNALVVESGLPHFEIVPVKYTLVFTYISYYHPEELGLIRDAFISVKNPLQSESRGAHLLRIIQESKGIYGPDISDFLKPENAEKAKENEKRKKEQKEFNNSHPLLYFLLLSEKGENPFIKYLDFYLRSDSIHYTKYIDKYKEYGVNGFNGVTIEFANSSTILNRLLNIREQFNPSFYNECNSDLIEVFTRGNKNAVAKEYLYNYYEFLFALLLNSSNPSNYLGIIMSRINFHHAEYPDKIIDILSILDKIDGVIDSDNYPDYYKNFSKDTRYSLVSKSYNEILTNIKERLLTLPFNNEEIEENAIMHLEILIDERCSYYLIEEAFFSCRNGKARNEIRNYLVILPNACMKFKKYIENYPDEFITNCIRKIMEPNYQIIFHPFLMQIFNNSKDEVIKYFENVKCRTKKSRIILRIIQKYLNVYLSDAVQNSEYMEFQIEKDDYNRIFNYSNEEEEQKEHLEPSLQAAHTVVSKKAST